jgi:glycosyltransferase involved in cell wall biosynthesis
VTFVILSFEGPDVYSHVGGLGTRVTGLSSALAHMGFETHVFFVGDPRLPEDEATQGGRLNLHRLCRQASRRHPENAYDGQEEKLREWRALPLRLEVELLAPRVARGGQVVVIAEEWQTAGTMIALRRIVERRRWQHRVRLMWNANNTYCFDSIDWSALRSGVTITTVSRHMKQVMAAMGVEAMAVPNGITECWLDQAPAAGVRALSALFSGRLSLVKVARWDSDKGWCVSIDAVAALKSMGLQPLLLARGGAEPYGRTVLEWAAQQKLSVSRVSWGGTGVEHVVEALRPHMPADIVLLETYLSESQRRSLFKAADAVLANSRWEPFGLVGLETMSAGGVAVVGCTGEDYATPGFDSLSTQTGAPFELVRQLVQLKESPPLSRRLRRRARASAARYVWPLVIERSLLPALGWTTAGDGLIHTWGGPSPNGWTAPETLADGVERARAATPAAHLAFEEAAA